MRLSTLCLLFTIALTGCLFPYAIPGVRTEVGDSWTGAREGRSRFGIGAHLASTITPSANPLTRVDAGVGILLESGDSSPGVIAREEPLTGVYADLGFAVLQNTFGRIIVGLRGEARATDITETHSKSVKLRVDAEIYKHVTGAFSGSGRCGATAGIYEGLTAIGLYAESGPAIYQDGHEWAATIGFTARLPTIAGIALGVPGCK